MPPIKRTQKPVPPPPRRRLAGHSTAPTPSTAPTLTTAPTPTTAPATGPGSRSWLEKTRHDDEVGAPVSAAGTRSASGRARPTGRSLAYAALAVGLVAGAAGAYLATEPGVNAENQAFVDRAATDEVLAAASTNVQRLVAIDHESLDEYHDSLGEFLTPNLVEELDKNWPALRDSYEQSATTVDAQVSEAGLSYLADDRAEVLLVQDVSMMRDGVAAGSTSGTYLVGLDKVDGVWKLSRIPDLPS